MPDVALSADGRLLVAASNGPVITFWDLAEARPRLLKTPTATTDSLALTPDARTLISAGSMAPRPQGALLLWDLPAGTVRRVAWQQDTAHMELSPDGRLVAVGRQIYDTANGERVADPTPAPALWVAFTPDGGSLACDDHLPDERELGIGFYPVEGGGMTRFIGTGRRVGAMPPVLVGARVRRIAVSPAGVLAASLTDGSVAIWPSMAAPDPLRLANVSHAGEGIGGPAMAFSRDNRTLALASADRLELRDVPTGQLRRVLWGRGLSEDARPSTGLPGGLFEDTALSFSADGILASGSFGGSARLWDPDAGREIAAFFTLDDGDNWLIATPEGYHCGTLDGPAEVGWRLALRAQGKQLQRTLLSIEAFSARWNRPDLVRRLLRGEPLPADAPRLPADLRPPLVMLETPSAEEVDLGSKRKAWRVPGDMMPVRITVRPGGTGAPIRKVELRLNGRAVEGERVQDVKVIASGEDMLAKPAAGNQDASTPVDKGLSILGVQPAIEVKELEDPRERGVVVTATVRLLPGEGALQLIACAWDEQEVRGTSPAVALGRKDAPGQAGDLYVLAAGINEADGAGPALSFADADARAVADALKEQEGKAFARVHARVLVNGEVTGAALLAGARWLQEGPKANDVAVLFLSGHATLDAGDRPDLLTADLPAPVAAQEGAPEAAESQELPTAGTARPEPTVPLWPQTCGALRRCKARQVVAFLDCYRATTLGDRVIVPDALAGPLVLDAGAATLLACRWHEGSLEVPAVRHGIFTKALLDGLAGAAAAKGARHVSLGGLQSYVARAVPRLANNTQHPWAPRAALFDANLVVAVLPADQKAAPWKAGRKVQIGQKRPCHSLSLAVIGGRSAGAERLSGRASSARQGTSVAAPRRREY